MYIKIQMRQDHISTCISKYPISKIITAMSLPLFVPERDKVPQSPPLYPRKKQMDDNSIEKYLTSKSTNIHISTKNKYPKIKYSYQHPKKKYKIQESPPNYHQIQ